MGHLGLTAYHGWTIWNLTGESAWGLHWLATKLE